MNETSIKPIVDSSDELILTSSNRIRKILYEFFPDSNRSNTPLPEPKPARNLYSIKELADFLGCSIVTAFKLKKSGRVRYTQFGRKLVFNSAEVLEDLKKKKG